MRRPLLLLLLCFLVAQASAWSRDGHRIVGELAQRQLKPAALAEVRRLLAGEPEPTLAGVAAWADEVRAAEKGRSLTDRWHYINFKGGDCSYVPARDCPDGGCVVGAINRQFLALADRARPDAERRDALKYLVHFVGDVHQPLHASPKTDQGGNDYQVNFRGKGGNLHGVWDRTILEQRGLAAPVYAAKLAAGAPMAADPTRRSDRPAVDWALESCRIVRDGQLYPARRVIDETYIETHRPLAEQRLRQAGSRLADMLNHALAPARP